MTRAAEGGSPRYEFPDVDLESGSTHADVVLLTGEGRRVLELGPASGYMTKAFAERGCTVTAIELDAGMAEAAGRHAERVIVGDLDQLDPAGELGDERFDVIVAADVLEHLRDPLRLLRQLGPFLTPDGYFVLSVPNIAHGSVRLALLEGRFDYQEVGLLDRTHVTFFTAQSFEALLDDAELGVAVLNRHVLQLAASEVPFDPDAVPEVLRRQLESDPEALTYQFVAKAFPMARPGLREMQRRLHESAHARSVAELEAGALRERAGHLEAQVSELGGALAQISARDGELRATLVESHDQLLRQSAEVEELRSALEECTSENERLRALRRGDQAWSAELAAALEDKDREVRRLGSLAVEGRRGLARRVAREVRSLLSGR